MKYYLSLNMFNVRIKNKAFISLIDLISFINISDDTYKFLNRKTRKKIICYRKNINIIDSNIGDHFIKVVDSNNNKIDLNNEIHFELYERKTKYNYEFTDYVINNSRFYFYGSKTLNWFIYCNLTVTKNDYSQFRKIMHRGYNKASCDLKYTSDLCYRYYGVRIKASYPKMITNCEDLYASSKLINNWKKNKVKSQYSLINCMVD